MSYNRLSYDQCAYQTQINESVGPLEYHLNPMKFENCNKCRHEFGLLGGTNVSHIKGNIVDLENDLRGQTRPTSKCPSKKYAPSTDNTLKLSGNHCNSARTVDLTPLHLAPCQMIRYPAMPLPPQPNLQNCPVGIIQNRNPCGN